MIGHLLFLLYYRNRDMSMPKEMARVHSSWHVSRHTTLRDPFIKLLELKQGRSNVTRRWPKV